MGCTTALSFLTRTSNRYEVELHCNCSVAPSKTCWLQACGASHLRGEWPTSVAESGQERRTNLSGALYSAPDKSGTPGASHLRGELQTSVAENGQEGRTNLSGALYSAPDKSGTPPGASHLRGELPTRVADHMGKTKLCSDPCLATYI